MARTDFTKVEERLIEGLRKMFIHRLLEMAESASPKEVSGESIEQKGEGGFIRKTTREESRKSILRAMRRDLKRLKGNEQIFEEKLGITKQEIHQFVEDPSKLTAEDWEKIKSLKKEMESHEEELSQPIEKDIDEKLVETERIKHINKRFNVREGWLPLH